MTNQDERIEKMTFASVYPHYVAKVEKKGRNLSELHEIIKWLTGYDSIMIQSLIDQKVSFKEFFAKAHIPKDAEKIKGIICGYRIEDISNVLTRQVRYLDKIVDELAKGKSIDKIIHRKP